MARQRASKGHHGFVPATQPTFGASPVSFSTCMSLQRTLLHSWPQSQLSGNMRLGVSQRGGAERREGEGERGVHRMRQQQGCAVLLARDASRWSVKSYPGEGQREGYGRQCLESGEGIAGGLPSANRQAVHARVQARMAAAGQVPRELKTRTGFMTKHRRNASAASCSLGQGHSARFAGDHVSNRGERGWSSWFEGGMGGGARLGHKEGICIQVLYPCSIARSKLPGRSR